MIYKVKSSEIPMGGFVVGLARVSKPNKEGEVFIKSVETIYEGHGDGSDIFGAMSGILGLVKQNKDVYFFYNEFDDPDIFGINELAGYCQDEEDE